MKCQVCGQEVRDGEIALLGSLCRVVNQLRCSHDFQLDDEYVFVNDSEPIAIHVECINAKSIPQCTTVVGAPTSPVERSDALNGLL